MPQGFSPQLQFFPLLSIPLSSLFYGFSDQSYDIVGYLVHFEKVIYTGLQDHITELFVVNPRNDYILPPRFPFQEDVLIIVQ